MPEPAASEQPLGGEGTEHARGARPSLPRLPSPATVDTVPDGARVSVIVRGEIDLDTSQRLRPGLLHALNGAADGVDLYLSEVTFCDCSGINLLLDLRRLALLQDKTVTVLSRSPAVERMFDLTATHDMFEPSEPADPEGEHTIGPTGGEEVPAKGDMDTRDDQYGKDYDESLRTVVSQFQRGMHTNLAEQPGNTPQPSSPGTTPQQPPQAPPGVT